MIVFWQINSLFELDMHSGSKYMYNVYDVLSLLLRYVFTVEGPG